MKPIFALLFFLVLTASAQPPAVRFELASVPQVSQAASRLDNAIAPRFRDTAAAVTLVLTLGATRYGMDLTRPLEIRFYSFGEKPAMRIIAHALSESQEPQDRGKLWGQSFRGIRKGDLIVFDSEGVSEPFPTAPPGKNLKKGELLRGFIQADPVHRHFRFSSFNAKDTSARLILSGLDELLEEIRDAEVIFSADENSLKVELSVRPKERSAVLNWMKQPLPPKGQIEIFPGTDLVSVLRMNPSAVLKEYGRNYLIRKRTNVLPKALPDAVTGFAVMAIRNEKMNPAVRLAVGIDPARTASVRQEIGKLDYTPFPNWFQIHRQPPLFCSENGSQAIFCGMESLDRTTLENLFRPQICPLAVPDRPFVCLDLKHPDRPLAELRFEKDVMRLLLQAPDDWFAGCRPLLEKPLLLPEGNRGR